MTHEEIRARLMGAMDRSLDPQETDEVERHMADCEACRLEQVELHRMRRSLDREERQREADLCARSRWGPLGLNGLLRVGALALALAVLALAWHRKHPAPPPPAPPLPSGRGDVVPRVNVVP